MAEHDYGALAAALAKAQATFPPISREREVTVTSTRTGKSYKFKYAPLDTILGAVRQPLASNGLAILQLLDEDTLVTSLLHESGAIISGRTPIPQTEGVQEYGSAITYLRRYAIQALLGIAAEEDDDGNRAAGNTASYRQRGSADPGVKDRVADYVEAERKATGVDADDPSEPVYQGSWSETGHLIVNKSGDSDGNIRQSPEGPWMHIAFGTVDQKKLQLEFRGQLAQDLVDAEGGKLDGLVCTIEGDLYRVPWQKGGKPMPPYQRLVVQRIRTDGYSLPAPEPTAPMFPDLEAEKELDGLLP